MKGSSRCIKRYQKSTQKYIPRSLKHGTIQIPRTLNNQVLVLKLGEIFTSQAGETMIEPQRHMPSFEMGICQASFKMQSQEAGQTGQREREKGNQQYQN